jgi:hypothetical protein
VRRLTLTLVTVSLLAGCGGSGDRTPSRPSAQDKVASAYTTFFSPRTPLSRRVGLLQNGPRFKELIQEFERNPLARHVSVSVSSVALDGNIANVVYTVKLGGSRLPRQTGTAVRENGVWKVGLTTLCQLIAMQGKRTSACVP